MEDICAQECITGRGFRLCLSAPFMFCHIRWMLVDDLLGSSMERKHLMSCSKNCPMTNMSRLLLVALAGVGGTGPSLVFSPVHFFWAFVGVDNHLLGCLRSLASSPGRPIC